MKLISIRKNSPGQVLIIAVISIFVLLGVSALAIDLGMAYAVKAKINAAVDAAALAAGKAVKLNDSKTEAETAAITFFDANFPAGFMGATNTIPTATATRNNDGSWTISVKATTVNPTFFSRVFGTTGTTVVGASAEAVTKTVDVMLVLDFSGSLVNSGSVGALKAAANNFLNVFSQSDDRVGLVFFESGAIIPTNSAINNPQRGFKRNILQNAINSASAGGWTDSAEAMRIARAEMNAIPAIQRNSLRAIVFFSDGLPNVANFNLGTSASPINRGLESMELIGTPKRPRPYSLVSLNSPTSGSYATFPSIDNHVRIDISSLSTPSAADANKVDLAIYNPSFRQITFTGSTVKTAKNDECNANMAARSQLEFFAEQARNEGIIIYSIGLGNLGVVEEDNCWYTVANESGENIMKRVAASPGVYVNASDASDLNSAFQKVASMILRLTR